MKFPIIQWRARWSTARRQLVGGSAWRGIRHVADRRSEFEQADIDVIRFDACLLVEYVPAQALGCGSAVALRSNNSAGANADSRFSLRARLDYCAPQCSALWPDFVSGNPTSHR